MQGGEGVGAAVQRSGTRDGRAADQEGGTQQVSVVWDLKSRTGVSLCTLMALCIPVGGLRFPNTPPSSPFKELLVCFAVHFLEKKDPLLAAPGFSPKH